MNEMFCKKIFLKDGSILLGLVEKSKNLDNAKTITTAKRTYDIKDEEIIRIESTNTLFQRWE